MDAAADQSADSASSAMQPRSKLRYPLRSAAKTRDEKSPPVVHHPMSSSAASKRGRQPSAVSKSMSVFDPTSGKQRSSRPAKRLSVPSRVTASLQTGPSGSITPVTENNSKKSRVQGKNQTTPLSDVSKSALRRRFSVLSSVSYWLSQIKLSESASKHSISLGFFKLAIESGCEPQERIHEELKTYAVKHNVVAELGEPAKDLLQSCGILEDLERLQLSEPFPGQQEEGTKSKNISPTAARTGRLKPRSLNSETPSKATQTKKQPPQKPLPAARTKTVTEANGNVQKKTIKVNKVEPAKGVARSKTSAVKSSVEKVDASSAAAAEIAEENKENLEKKLPEEVNQSDEV